MSIELKLNEIVEKLDLLQKSVNHLSTKQDTLASSTELQDLLKNLPLNTAVEVENFNKKLTESGQKALVQHFKLVSGSHLLNFVRNILRTVFKDECLISYCWTGSEKKKCFQDLIEAMLHYNRGY